ncbi:unnamed protein product [Mesocestoides corti]|uniref:Uncharacterized protein n=1 Tax=Mesocestoides corti TaxID=53468 RepID=A0A0R3U3T2_MESCO|nr:unnamed protein product [Mesocestoides corti]
MRTNTEPSLGSTNNADADRRMVTEPCSLFNGVAGRAKSPPRLNPISPHPVAICLDSVIGIGHLPPEI